MRKRNLPRRPGRSKEAVTPVMLQLLGEISKRGGKVKSLYALTGTIGIDYRHAYDCVGRLEQAGLVTVYRNARQAMEISLSPIFLP